MQDIRTLMFDTTSPDDKRGDYAYLLRMSDGADLKRIGLEAHILYTKDPMTTAVQRQGSAYITFCYERSVEAGFDIFHCCESIPLPSILAQQFFLQTVTLQMEAIKAVMPQLGCEDRLALRSELDMYFHAHYTDYFRDGCCEDTAYTEECAVSLQNAQLVRATLDELNSSNGIVMSECGEAVL